MKLLLSIAQNTTRHFVVYGTDLGEREVAPAAAERAMMGSWSGASF